MHASLIVPMLFTILAAPAAELPTIDPQARPKILLERPSILRVLPKVDAVMVYRTRPDAEWVDAKMRRAMDFFGVGAKLQPSRTQAGLLVAQEGPRYAEVFQASGGSFCADMERIWPLVPPSDFGRIDRRALSRNVVLEVAQQLVRQLDALPKEKVRPVYLPETLQVLDESGERRRVVISASVLFRRVVDGLTVEGPGGKLKVYFDEQGKPAGLLRTMRVLQPYRKLPIRAASDVMAELRKVPVRRQLLAGVRSVELSRLRLVYYEAPADQEQKFLQPAYMATGVARGRVGEHSFSVPYCEFVPALKKPLEPMFGRGRVFDTKSRVGPEAPPQWQQDDE